MPVQVQSDYHCQEETEDCRASDYGPGMSGQTPWARGDHGSLDGDGFPDGNGKTVPRDLDEAEQAHVDRSRRVPVHRKDARKERLVQLSCAEYFVWPAKL